MLAIFGYYFNYFKRPIHKLRIKTIVHKKDTLNRSFHIVFLHFDYSKKLIFHQSLWNDEKIFFNADDILDSA